MKFVRPLLLASLFLLDRQSLFAQGSLTPPSGPATMWRTLGQIEPRIDINGFYTGTRYVISQPGSVFLSADIFLNNAILISASNVTLDMNGFFITPLTTVGTGAAIEISSGAQNVSIRNGTVKANVNGGGFSTGILCPAGSRGVRLRDLILSGCTTNGISTGTGAVIESCIAQTNSGTAGINAGVGSTLTNCSAVSNSSTYGIYAGVSSALHNCAVSNHNNTGATACGIFVGHGSSLSNCSASGNTVTFGIWADEGSSFTNCTASYDTGTAAIRARFHCSLTGCAASYNTTTYGIQTDSSSLMNCTTNANSGIGFYGYGSTLDSCMANNNSGVGMIGTEISNCSAGVNGDDGIQVTSGTVVNSSAIGNAADGIQISGGTVANSSAIDNGTAATGSGIVGSQAVTIVHCVARSNHLEGIYVSSDCLVLENTCNLNGTGVPDGCGIYLAGRGNRIDGNNVSSNDIGIKTVLDGNLIIKNSTRGNSTSFSLAAGNSVGEQINVWNAGAGATITTSNSWANLLY
jgi:hypothetical protein